MNGYGPGISPKFVPWVWVEPGSVIDEMGTQRTVATLACLHGTCGNFQNPDSAGSTWKVRGVVCGGICGIARPGQTRTRTGTFLQLYSIEHHDVHQQRANGKGDSGAEGNHHRGSLAYKRHILSDKKRQGSWGNMKVVLFCRGKGDQQEVQCMRILF